MKDGAIRNGRVRKTVLLLATTGLCAVGGSTAAFAQTTGGSSSAADNGRIGEIVVSAQRRPERLQRVPVSVTVVSGKSLEQKGIRTLSDVATRQADFQISSSPTSDLITVRGTGSGENQGFEQSVPTFVDDVHEGRSRSVQIALFDVDQLEILKGPQTIFFGANAIAGALNIITRKPTDKLEGFASVLYSPSDGEYDTEAAVGGPVTDVLDMRVSGRLSGMGGYIHDEKTGGYGPHDQDGQLRAALRYKPNDRLTVDVRYDYARNNDGQAVDAVIYEGKPPNVPSYTSYAGPTYRKITFHQGEVTANLGLDIAKLTSTTSYTYQKFGQLGDIDTFPGPSPIGTLSWSPSQDQETSGQFSQELRIQSLPGKRLQYSAGAYYENEELNTENTICYCSFPLGAIPPVAAADPAIHPNTPLGFYNIGQQRSQALSGFASAGYQITQQLTLNAGIRLSQEYKTGALRGGYGSMDSLASFGSFSLLPPIEQNIISAVLGPLNDNGYAQPKLKEGAATPSANIQYQFNPDVMGYFSYSQGFKAGGFSAAESNEFKPERVQSYELGLKALWLDHKLQTNVTLFRENYKDLQETENLAVQNSFIEIVTNAAASISQGVEFNGQYRFTPNFSVSANVAYLDAHFIDFPNAPCYNSPLPSCMQNLSGKMLPFATRWSGQISADYEQRLPRDYELAIDGTIYAKTSYNEQGVLDPGTQQGGYAKVDLSASIVDPSRRWTYSIIGKNILNKKTYSYIGEAPGFTGDFFAIPDRPLSVAGSVTYRF